MTAMSAAHFPLLSFDTTDPAFVADPWARYREIRALGGVVFNERINRWMVGDFDLVKQILSAPSRFGSERGQVEHAAVFGGPTMEFYDGPHHDQIRSIWSGDFRPRTLARLRPVITDIVRARLEPVDARLRDGETVEIVSELTRGIPTEVIAHMLGVEPEMVDQFTSWSDAMGASAEGYSMPGAHGAELIAAGRHATAQLNSYIREQLPVRGCPAEGSWDLIGTMVGHQYACEHMTEQEIVASNTQLVFAGNETTAKLLAQIVATLANHPEQRRILQSDRNLALDAVEEVHRLETVSHSIFRDVVGDGVTVGDVAVADGERITLLLGAANRDPRRWDRPDDFDVTRRKLSHLGFAFGLHSCLGMNLARLEAQIFLEELIDTVGDWQLAAPLDYGTNYTVRGPGRVLVAAA
ncbi:cytochrome P450 [Mycolicibacterium boenickei]|uniref:Cytochrome P450 n=2 Tax=Mycolicibacterium boenickei TaxID=146017 RepID=A0AAX2ZRA4_9MYCO|nr:cytochrome P450 [Mycolicibacterium boenickei]PEG60905.1 cytochrome P450 [Mycolicibacterium boenickei]UNB97645.1 cytochrome P450 [Mycolicibacterium boenickei]